MRFSRPKSLEAALEALAEEDALALAGGVSLVLLMNIGFVEPRALVSLADVPGLRGVSTRDGCLDVGALCTHDELARHPLVLRHFPAAARMFHGIGNIRVRCAGTVGGNLVHADPAQDPPVMLSALEARATVVGADGVETLPVEDLAEGPLITALREDQILTRIFVPLPAEGETSSYLKYLTGSRDDYATVSVAAKLAVAGDGRVASARLAAGSLESTVRLLPEGAALLVGNRPDDEDMLAALRDAVREAVSPLADQRGSADYKRELAGVVAARAVRACADPDDRRGMVA